MLTVLVLFHGQMLHLSQVLVATQLHQYTGMVVDSLIAQLMDQLVSIMLIVQGLFLEILSLKTLILKKLQRTYLQLLHLTVLAFIEMESLFLIKWIIQMMEE